MKDINKREWLSGGASPCQGEGRGFESRLALLKTEGGTVWYHLFCCIGKFSNKLKNAYLAEE